MLNAHSLAAFLLAVLPRAVCSGCVPIRSFSLPLIHQFCSCCVNSVAVFVQRNLKDEKGRFRARAEEAERERKERKMVVLSSKPVQGKGEAT